MTVEKCRSLLVFNFDKHTQYDILESLLRSHESLNIYRYSYRSYLNLENVINLILLDKEYANSLTYQIRRIQKDVNRLPHSEATAEYTTCQKHITEANNKIENLSIEDLLKMNKDGTLRENLDDALAELSMQLHKTSLVISDTYFNHAYQQKQLVNQNFPLT